MPLRQHLLLAAIILPLALFARWGGDQLKGARFHPRPDALEYGAVAQSLAQSGQAYLQIGPHRVRSRYPPGWPLILAAGVKVGLPGQSLWKVTGLFGAALAWLLAMVAVRGTELLCPGGSRAGPWIAGLLAGCGWALAPIAVYLGQTAMSDEPAAFVSLVSFTLSAAAFLRRNETSRRGVLLLAAGGGLAFGLAASMRPVVAALLVPPLAIMLLGAIRRVGIRAVLRRTGMWGLGGLVFPAVTALILLRSGLPPWEWSGYELWVPQRHEHLTDTFHIRYALEPDKDFRLGFGGRPLSHLEIAARVLFGLPGLRLHHYLGYWWPILGWLATIPLLWAALRKRGPVAEAAPWVASALALWSVEHLILFSLYFYPSSRFYLAPLALCLTLFATACGVGLSASFRGVQALCLVIAVLVGGLTLEAHRDSRHQPLPRLKMERTRVQFARWMRMPDERRAGRTMPFDPVHAQALGLLTREVAEKTRVWGELPDTVHIRRMRVNGYIPPAKMMDGPQEGVR